MCLYEVPEAGPEPVPGHHHRGHQTSPLWREPGLDILYCDLLEVLSATKMSIRHSRTSRLCPPVSQTDLQYLGTTDSSGVDEGEGQAVEGESEGRQGEVGLDGEVGENVADTVEARPNTD